MKHVGIFLFLDLVMHLGKGPLQTLNLIGSHLYINSIGSVNLYETVYFVHEPDWCKIYKNLNVHYNIVL